MHITVPGIYDPFLKTLQFPGLYAKDWPTGSAQEVNDVLVWLNLIAL